MKLDPPLWQILLAMFVGALGAVMTFGFGAWLIAGFQ